MNRSGRSPIVARFPRRPCRERLITLLAPLLLLPCNKRKPTALFASRAIVLCIQGDVCARRGKSGHVALTHSTLRNCHPDDDRVRTTTLSPEVALSYHCLVGTRWCGPILGWARRKSAQSSSLVETFDRRRKTLGALRCLSLTAPCIAAPACFQLLQPHAGAVTAGCGPRPWRDCPPAPRQGRDRFCDCWEYTLEP